MDIVFAVIAISALLAALVFYRAFLSERQRFEDEWSKHGLTHYLLDRAEDEIRRLKREQDRPHVKAGSVPGPVAPPTVAVAGKRAVVGGRTTRRDDTSVDA